LSSNCMVIEGAFGLLKDIFRVLKKALKQRSSTALVRNIVACSILPNLLTDLQDSAPIIIASTQDATSAENEIAPQKITNQDGDTKRQLHC
ncbi:hypothetical protein PHYSODRAFT_403919, partial [Phytophthora sojae]